MSCPHCGSRSIPFSDVDRLSYCMNCNRGEYRPLPPDPYLIDMLETPEHHKNVEFICTICGKMDEKPRNSTRMICADCRKKRDNDTNNRIKRERPFYNSQERYPKPHTCMFCDEVIKGRVYKKRNVREWCCEVCFKKKYGKKGAKRA